MVHAVAAGPVLSRRDRMRAETAQEIKQVARRILVEEGPDSVSLRAIAREMGMTAPALYRYFAGRDELLRNVVADIFLEISGDIQAAIDAAAAGGLSAKFGAAAREFRRWSLTHRREFNLLFGTPLPEIDLKHPDIADECSRKFGETFIALFTELWRKQPFPVAAPDDIPADLRRQLERYRDTIGADLPVGAILMFLQCWVRLYGMVSLEVFDHLAWALDDAEPMFEMMLEEVGPLLGLEVPAAKPR